MIYGRTYNCRLVAIKVLEIIQMTLLQVVYLKLLVSSFTFLVEGVQNEEEVDEELNWCLQLLSEVSFTLPHQKRREKFSCKQILRSKKFCWTIRFPAQWNVTRVAKEKGFSALSPHAVLLFSALNRNIIICSRSFAVTACIFYHTNKN